MYNHCLLYTPFSDRKRIKDLNSQLKNNDTTEKKDGYKNKEMKG